MSWILQLLMNHNLLLPSFCAGFLEDQNHLKDIRETLNLIASPELKLLSKSLNIQSKSAGQKGSVTKKDTIEMIVHHAENQKTLFGSLKGVVLKK